MAGKREKGSSFGFGRAARFGQDDDQLDAETRNRYRLRFAKLSEVLPRSERSLATVRMTIKETWNRRQRW